MTNTTNVLVSAYAPFPSTLSLQLPSNAPALATLSHVLSSLCPLSQQSLSLSNGRSIPSDANIGSISPGADVQIRLCVRLPGGKGGFGSQLRAAGGRMNSKRAGQNNTDSCRDLNGRRLSTIKEAKKLADYLSSAPEREAARIQQTKERLERLQEEIRRADGEIESARSGASTSAAGQVVDREGAPEGAEEGAVVSNAVAGPSVTVTSAAAKSAGRKRRLDDQKYVEESREIVDNVKSAVAAAMLKKRKMQKTSPPVAASSSTAVQAQTPSTNTKESANTAAPVVAASA